MANENYFNINQPYLARVELHEKVPGEHIDYKPLHEAMATQGYERTIVSDNDSNHQLPTGTYGGSFSDIEVARARVASAVKAAKRNASWIVVEYTRATWVLPNLALLRKKKT